MPLLIVTSEDSQLSQMYQVREECFTVGRSPQSALPVADRSVSRAHVMIRRTSAGYTFKDLLSENGTYLNEVRLESGVLKDGDVLRIGRVRITFKDDAAPEPPPAETTRLKSMGGERVRPLSFRRALLFSGLCAAGIGAGLLLGSLGSSLFKEKSGGPGAAPGEERPPSSAPPPPATAGPPALAAEPKESGKPAPPATAAGTAGQAAPPGAAALIAGEAIRGSAALEVRPAAVDSGEVLRISEELSAGLKRPYADPAESERVLFRLSLDLLERSPTRAEASELLPLGHAERWKNLTALSGKPPPGELDPAYQRFLGRLPGAAERLLFGGSVLAAAGEEGDPPLGLLLTASSEYRAPALRRSRSLRQRARSLIVDLLDRPPRGEEEVKAVESCLLDYPGGFPVARVLAYSADAERTLESAGLIPPVPGKPGNGAEGTPLWAGGASWVQAEFQRFLLRPPTAVELQAVEAELGRERRSGARWVRLTLSSSAGYRSY